MTEFSLDDRIIIAEHPLGSSLDHLREPLQKVEQTYGPDSLSYNGNVNSSDEGPQKATSRLLTTLMGHEVALNLRSKTANRNVASELATLVGRIRKGDFNYEHYVRYHDLSSKMHRILISGTLFSTS